ncbi:MAG: peptide deformylase [Acidithiobacillales bacterium SG8_45]|jgi:peptide deformylase|nr:MAG: peptide deformylase [Acidithiobacillales bacterium SG8_45]
MAVLHILTYPDSRLSDVALAVTEFDASLQQLVADLQETMLDGPSAVGIAAPQVGVRLRVAIVDVGPMLESGQKRKPKSSYNGRLVLVNPEIVERDGKVTGREGCLSVPDYTGNVLRADSVRVRAQDVLGGVQEIACSGFESRAIQHEMDHLDGKLFLDRVLSSRELFRRKI